MLLDVSFELGWLLRQTFPEDILDFAIVRKVEKEEIWLIGIGGIVGEGAIEKTLFIVGLGNPGTFKVGAGLLYAYSHLSIMHIHN